ncbi:valine--tRNA ligase [Mycoplasmatota bacterium]|nr:valine--tRNA ligase [Mycoplasmatota bacterium]
MSKKDLAKKYNHQEVEKGKYQYWIDNGFFKADVKSNRPQYTIVIPPPNVTGKLHLGHAWNTTIQDIIIRRKRMQGYDALWLPGMDHAGIATQAKIDAKLAEQNISRYDLGREKFLEAAWEWKKEYADFIREQWSTVGLSLDYSRERFTLDEGLNQAVNKVFVDLYNKGLIYRGERIINWDVQAKTALSNIEVEHKEVEGAFYYFKYMLEDGSGYLEVATTRPETMFGDVAVAVHPKDDRYKHLVGKKVLVPGNKLPVPIIFDEYVDREFGTGAVKITPAHDPNDFEVGNRHNLSRPICINTDGTMNELAGKYEGLERFQCRKQLVSDLQAENLVVKIEKHLHSVGHSERTGVIVEPYLSKQWFVKMRPLADRVLDIQQDEDKKVNFFPERFEKTLNQWMENAYDWCISRQLWWGHRIPAYYHKETGEVLVSEKPPKDIENYIQDEDVLDTWFSSALWPFSTLGWPDTSREDYKKFFPNDVLVTAYDIIFFWVARMIFQSLELTDTRPFKTVLIHGLIRDSEGRKMSKSLGNGVDPMDVIDKYGCDSLRYFLTTNSAPGQDLRFVEEKIEASWNFINKIWNASRYVLMNLENTSDDQIEIEKSELNVADKWILTRLNETIKIIDQNYEKFEFGEVSRHLNKFVWEDYCDWYIEMSKLTLYGDDEKAKQTTRAVLTTVLEAILKLLHPFMPFVTEEIYQSIPHSSQSITISAWLTVNKSYQFDEEVTIMNSIQEIIKSVRNMRSEVNTPLSKPIDMMLKTTNKDFEDKLIQNQAYINKFCNTSKLTIASDFNITEKVMTSVITNGEILVPLKGLIDIEGEIERLKNELVKLENEVSRCEKMLMNPNFVNKAPKHKVDSEKEKLVDYKTKYQMVKERLKEL